MYVDINQAVWLASTLFFFSALGLLFVASILCRTVFVVEKSVSSIYFSCATAWMARWLNSFRPGSVRSVPHVTCFQKSQICKLLLPPCLCWNISRAFSACSPENALLWRRLVLIRFTLSCLHTVFNTGVLTKRFACAISLFFFSWWPLYVSSSKFTW